MMSTVWLIPALFTLAVTLWFLWRGKKAALPTLSDDALNAATVAAGLPAIAGWKWTLTPKAVRFTTFRLTWRSLLPLLVILAIYTPIEFWKLGSTDTPTSFAVMDGGAVTLDFGENAFLPQKMTAHWYGGLNTGSYNAGFTDGTIWLTEIEAWEQDYVALFKWHSVTIPKLEDTTGVRYFQIFADTPGMELGEIIFTDELGVRIPIETAMGSDAEKLIDEQNLVFDESDWMYNTYFDEIYHPRTALEHIRGISPYEISHPPLGKIIMGLGIRLFGMTPFGWRFMGALFGVLMLIPFYIFVQNMFGKSLISTCATLLFAFDFMHFVQTRIATIDTYAVFFILLMYYFMFRYYTQPTETPLWRSVPWLFLSGLAFGLGAASKWIVIYGGLGLLWLWFIRQLEVARAYSNYENQFNGQNTATPQSSVGDGRIKPEVLEYAKYLWGTIGLSVLFFIVIPGLVYCLSYIPYAKSGYGASADGSLGGYLEMVWENCKYMMNYHGGLNAEHPYSSMWWQWVIDFRPILYFQWFHDNGTKSVFGGFTNPLITWTGFGAFIMMLKVAAQRKDKLAHLIAAGYLSQIVPWLFISRIAFAYHYFPNVIFLVLAIAFLMNKVSEMEFSKPKLGQHYVVRFTAAAILLFVLFYPALSGLSMGDEYAHLLGWFNGKYPF